MVDVSRVEVMGIPRYLKLVTTSMVAAWREGEAGKGNVLSLTLTLTLTLIFIQPAKETLAT
jgi:hypothetical protein